VSSRGEFVPMRYPLALSSELKDIAMLPLSSRKSSCPFQEPIRSSFSFGLLLFGVNRRSCIFLPSVSSHVCIR
jgi:hypothetical protein